MSPSSGVASFQARRLRALRQREGLSCEELAILAGISPETVRRAEDGSRRPSARIVAALATALATTVDELAPFKGPVTLRELRQRHGLTQRAIAAAAGVSTQMVSRVESGTYGVRDPARWAAAYQISEADWSAAWTTGRERRQRTIQARRKK